MKVLAREVRSDFGLNSPRVMKSDLRKIYKHFGIRVDLWPYRLREMRGAYFNDEYGPSVVIAKNLPDDPRIFTMAHELKHHLVDRELTLSYCGPDNETEPIEIGAEIFAAELIYPEQDFAEHLLELGVQYGACSAETLVRLKRETRTTLSYTGLAKRAVFMGFAQKGSLDGVQWKKLEESIYGEPIYKVLRRRSR